MIIPQSSLSMSTWNRSTPPRAAVTEKVERGAAEDGFWWYRATNTCPGCVCSVASSPGSKGPGVTCVTRQRMQGGEEGG